MKPVHLSGMGMLGCAAALALDAAGRAFTWDDADAVSAWPASSGQIVTDADSPQLEAARAAWEARQTGLAPDAPAYAPFLRRAARWLLLSRAPAAARAQARHAAACAGRFWRAGDDDLFLDVPGFVGSVRARYAHLRRTGPPADARPVTAHGFARARCFLWGWSAACAELCLPAGLEAASLPLPPALHVRPHRFMSAWVVPHGRAGYLIGTSYVRQTEPRQPQHPEQLIARTLERLGSYGVRVAATGPVRYGWRPLAVRGEPQVTVARHNGHLMLPALGMYGVTLSPLAAAALLRALEDEP
jgi:hypothetical protein